MFLPLALFCSLLTVLFNTVQYGSKLKFERHGTDSSFAIRMTSFSSMRVGNDTAVRGEPIDRRTAPLRRNRFRQEIFLRWRHIVPYYTENAKLPYPCEATSVATVLSEPCRSAFQRPQSGRHLVPSKVFRRVRFRKQPTPAWCTIETGHRRPSIGRCLSDVHGVCAETKRGTVRTEQKCLLREKRIRMHNWGWD